jgi:O-antigen/teichoic acid export membrane protein
LADIQGLMGIVFRQSIKTTIVILAGAVLGAIVNIGYTYVLEKQAAGFVRILFAQASVLQFLMLFGTGGTLMTFIQRYDSLRKQRVLLSLSAIIPFIGFLMLIVPYALFRGQIISLYQAGDVFYAARYYFLMPLLMLLWGYVFQMEHYLTAQHKAAVASFMREIVLKVLNIMLILLIGFRLISFTTFIVATVLLYIVPTVCLLPVAMRTRTFGFSAAWNAFTKAEYKELAHFSWYHLLMGLSVFALGQLDANMLGMLSKNGLRALAVYAIAVFITAVMTAPYRAMSIAAFPALNAAFISGDMNKVRNLFRRSSVNMLIVAVAMAALVGCNLHNAIAILPKDMGYELITPIVLTLMLGRLVDMSTGLNTELISISPYYKFNFYISILLVVLLVVLNRLLIPTYDLYGAAWGTTIALIIFNIGKMIFAWIKMGIQPFSRASVLILAAGAVAAAGGYFLPVLPNIFLDATVRTLLILGLFTGMLIWLKPSEDLRSYLQSVKEKKRLF